MADVTVKTNENGPLLVTGPITLTDHLGGVYNLGEKTTIALCRCGATENRPFCDGSHKACDYKAAEIAPSA